MTGGLQRMVTAILLGATAAVVVYGACLCYVRLAPPWLASLGDELGDGLMREGLRLEAASAVESAQERYEQALAARFAGTFNRAFTEKQLGVLLWRQGRYADAVPHLQAALASPEPSSTAYEPLADALFQLGRLEEALAVAQTWAAFAESREDRAAQAAALFQAGRVATQQGDLTTAVRTYEQSLALDPASTSASDLGILYAQQGDAAAAIRYLDQYLSHGGSGSRAAYARRLRERLAHENAVGAH